MAPRDIDDEDIDEFEDEDELDSYVDEDEEDFEEDEDEDEDEDSFSAEVEEDEYEQTVDQDVRDAGKLLAGEVDAFEGPGGASWQAATDIVNRVRPVPWLLWVLIRSVYGKSGELGSPDPVAFWAVGNLMKRAAADQTLGSGKKGEEKTRSLTKAVRTIGLDVAGTLCFMHAVCRRVSGSLPERVWRPLLDDALLRAHIGFLSGEFSPVFSPGRGMLAGFSGRCGLAIQIAAGTSAQAEKALAGLASGIEIGEVCEDVYGCDPLQVAALALIGGGCNRDIALGVAAFGRGHGEVVQGSEQHLWFSAFSVVEHMRMGSGDAIGDAEWRALAYDPAKKEALAAEVQLVQRRGHGWRWVIKSLSSMDSMPRKPTKRLRQDGDSEEGEQ